MAILNRKSTRRKVWENIRPHILPIYQTSVFDYPDLQALDEYYDGYIPQGYIYSRNGLPNASQLGNQIAELEGAEAGLVSSSGMASIAVLLLSSTSMGDRIVASSELYGGTKVLLEEELPRLGIATRFVDVVDFALVTEAVQKEAPKVMLVETISNPTLRVCDIKEIAKIAHESGAILVVDNTFASPFVLRPLEFGADIVMHSGTKFLGGHSDLTIGVACTNKQLIKRMSQLSTRFGTIAGPFDCWLSSRSISTWRVRMETSCASAMKLARFLESRSKVSKVYYPGLESSPDHSVAKRLFDPGMYGGMLSFDLKGGIRSAEKFVKSLAHVTLTPSLGGTRTTISHPGKTSHRHISEAGRRASGITDAMIRVSVGVESYEEIEKEFSHALKSAT